MSKTKGRPHVLRPDGGGMALDEPWIFNALAVKVPSKGGRSNSGDSEGEKECPFLKTRDWPHLLRFGRSRRGPHLIVASIRADPTRPWLESGASYDITRGAEEGGRGNEAAREAPPRKRTFNCVLERGGPPPGELAATFLRGD